MLIGNNYIFNLILLLNIITPFLIVIFLKKPWEKIPIYYGILILYIILSAWILHFFHLLNPFLWKKITIPSFFLFLLFFWKNKYWRLFELEEKIKFTLPNAFVYILIIGWIFITYFRIASLPIILSDSRTMHLFQQAFYFQECSFAFHNSNSWESAFRPLNALLWNMFFSIFLEDNNLIEIPQMISWVGLIFISGSIFSLLKINNILSSLIMLSIGFSPRILSLSTNNLIDLPSLLYFSGALYFLIKLSKTKSIKIIDTIMFGIYSGAYLGARMQGFILVPLLLIYFFHIIFRKQTIHLRNFLIPIFITIALGLGKYLINFSYYSSPIPLNINSSNSLSFLTFFENFNILINNMLDRSWNLYGTLSFQANSAIVGFPINFFIIPYAFFGCLNKKYRNKHNSSFKIYLIGLVFLLIAMTSLKSPSPNYNSRLWLPFIFTTIIFGTEIINTLIKEKKIITFLYIFTFIILLSVIFYGGMYRKFFALILFIVNLFIIKNRTITLQLLLKNLFTLVTISSLYYSIMNITYDKTSQILKYKEVNREYNQSVLVKLSKYFEPESRVGVLNLTDQNNFPIYDLFGSKHSIHARLVFDWNVNTNLKYIDGKELKKKYDFLILNALEHNEILKIENFLFIEKFEHYYIYQNLLK